MIGFLRGELGDPPGGWPEPFRTKALEGRRPNARPRRARRRRRARAWRADRAATLNRLLFPGPTKEFASTAEPTATSPCCRTQGLPLRPGPGVEHAVDLEPGVRLLIGLEAIGDADERGMRTVMCTLNGQLRPVQVRDRSVDADVKAAEKADRTTRAMSPHRSPAWSRCRSRRATRSRPAPPSPPIEAMKMEASITAPIGGTVERLAIGPVQQVEGGDLLVVLA